MINKIFITPDTKTAQILFVKEIDLSSLPDKHIVPLFGPNGCGKTTLIKAIAEYVGNIRLKSQFTKGSIESDIAEQEAKKSGITVEMDDMPIQLLSYLNGPDNFTRRQPRSLGEAFDPRFVSARFDAQSVSEGQSILYSLFDLLDGLRPGKDSFKKDGHQMIVLLDEIDSGLSIDNIDIIMRKIKSALSKQTDLQIFLSFNSPRILKYFPYVISMYDGQVHEMHNEDDMLAEIQLHKKQFDKVRKKSNGRPRIYE